MFFSWYLSLISSNTIPSEARANVKWSTPLRVSMVFPEANSFTTKSVLQNLRGL